MVALATPSTAADQQGSALARLQVDPCYSISNIDLHTGDTLSSLRQYYTICRDSTELMVTTSCFATWKKGKYRNGCAKVIPAVPVNGADGGEAARIFFFDDNINLHLGSSAGSANAKGICNLRDISAGEYIDFSDGKNGFVREPAFRHTLIHHSSEYKNVMVQVNILDAMSNSQYFTSIIEKFAKAGEKLIVYMDVNGTILWDDSIMGLGPDEVLLSTMFGCIRVKPWAPFDFVWDGQRTVRLEEPQVLKQLVHELSDGDKIWYRGFWTAQNCRQLLEELGSFGDLGWNSPGEVAAEPVCPQEFVDLHSTYMAAMRQQVVAHGMTSSWFQCLNMLKDGGHSAIIQSFGMDTLRVVRSSVADERRVLHITVNYELWSDRDAIKFNEQFHQGESRWLMSELSLWQLIVPPLCRSLGLGSCCSRESLSARGEATKK